MTGFICKFDIVCSKSFAIVFNLSYILHVISIYIYIANYLTDLTIDDTKFSLIFCFFVEVCVCAYSVDFLCNETVLFAAKHANHVKTVCLKYYICVTKTIKIYIYINSCMYRIKQQKFTVISLSK